MSVAVHFDRDPDLRQAYRIVVETESDAVRVNVPGELDRTTARDAYTRDPDLRSDAQRMTARGFGRKLAKFYRINGTETKLIYR